PLQQASILVKEDATYVKFDQPQSAITPGQFVAWYIENELVGSGVISE
ncbi:MAG: aminomethyltransferase beta-barrel domain-containing protein, partial [Flavobacteriaceae bacterium]